MPLPLHVLEHWWNCASIFKRGNALILKATRKITFWQLIIKYINHFPAQVLFDYYGTVSRKMDQSKVVVCGLFELHWVTSCHLKETPSKLLTVSKLSQLSRADSCCSARRLSGGAAFVTVMRSGWKKPKHGMKNDTQHTENWITDTKATGQTRVILRCLRTFLKALTTFLRLKHCGGTTRQHKLNNNTNSNVISTSDSFTKTIKLLNWAFDTKPECPEPDHTLDPL